MAQMEALKEHVNKVMNHLKTFKRLVDHVGNYIRRTIYLVDHYKGELMSRENDRRDEISRGAIYNLKSA